MSEVAALIVAAGRGQRFGGRLPKQYRPLAGRPVLRHSIDAFRRHPAVGDVAVAIHGDDRDAYDAATRGLALLPPILGGASRQDTVRRGLEALVPYRPRLVLIHDAARPLLPRAVIDRVLDALVDHVGAIAALPVTDSLKRDVDGSIAAAVDRRRLWRAQTPQGFHFDAILAAHRSAAGAEETDDAAVAERAGLAVALVEGSEDTLKITTEDDLDRAARLLTDAGETRVGNGFDVHRFVPGDYIMLCGIRVPHEAGALGHSDADVGLHALTDALLGAMGEGDIGHHFPPTDARWKGTHSEVFLRHAADLVGRRGGRIVHVDVTVVCERPKVAPHRAAMIARIADILGIEAQRVSVKATTTEGIGFAGRREGIAAQATATVRL
jgi:2-C-methyl-D-erythritol 4-phosphate cytidylyltransferase/2-C-methyl-D-erythritol 2,4-cyclodiphosphate synthase